MKTIYVVYFQEAGLVKFIGAFITAEDAHNARMLAIRPEHVNIEEITIR